LTSREREILRWIADGKRDGEIAVILGLAPKTVGKHVEHVLRKLGVNNRTAAVAASK
jgi:DNA-binding CsgD family transcriptional regulator